MANEPYFTEVELRDLPDVSDATKYPTARVEAARAWIEAIIERECGTSFVVRDHTDVVDGGNRTVSVRRYARAVTAVSVAGVALTAAELAALVITPTGQLYRTSGYALWPKGIQNVSVTYSAGYSTTPPADLKDAALWAARWKLLDRKSGIPDRALSIANEFGNINLATAGRERPTGLPEIDATIVAWRRKTRIPTCA